MESPIWLKTLKHFDRNNYVRNGLTIPFLLGSESIIVNNKDLSSVSEFINSITNEEFPCYLSLLKCGNIGEIIIGVLDQETLNYVGKKLSEYYLVFGKLVLMESTFKQTELRAIKDKLIEIYQPKIDNKTFSVTNGKWCEFSKQDLNKIKEITND